MTSLKNENFATFTFVVKDIFNLQSKTKKGQYIFCISLNQSQKRAITQSKICK